MFCFVFNFQIGLMRTGFIVKSTSDAMTPTSFSINSIPCKVYLVNNITGELPPDAWKCHLQAAHVNAKQRSEPKRP